jgi:hypothetical protein
MGKEGTRVEDWATDYDIFDAQYIKDPFPIWNELRRTCPIARTERWGGSWLPTRYADLQAFVKLVPALSSTQPLVVPPPPGLEPEGDGAEGYGFAAPPITADPPEQTETRRLLLPFLSPQAVAAQRASTEALCHELIGRFLARGACDAAVEYAQQIPPRVIAHILGVDPNRSEDFVEWVRGVLELGLSQPALRIKYRKIIRQFFTDLVAERQRHPKDDLISKLLASEMSGAPVPPIVVVGMCNLLLVAGIDTTWSSIGAALWHLAGHPADRRRLALEPGLFPTAIEELLRFYAPVTMARLVTKEVHAGGVTFRPGDRVLMNFPAANQDPTVFERADEVVLDRRQNRHIAFGVGIHRCAGSNLARMEMDVALRTWFEYIPEFELVDPEAVTWAGGQVRGPRRLPVRFPT